MEFLDMAAVAQGPQRRRKPLVPLHRCKLAALAAKKTRPALNLQVRAQLLHHNAEHAKRKDRPGRSLPHSKQVFLAPVQKKVLSQKRWPRSPSHFFLHPQPMGGCLISLLVGFYVRGLQPINESHLLQMFLQDDLILLGSGRRRFQGKGAKWKQWLPRAMLRCGFQDLSLNLRAVAQKMQSNHGMIRKLRGTLAQSLLQLQQRSMADLLSRPSSFVILTLLLDETRFKLKLKSEAVSTSSILWPHGLLRCVDGAGRGRREEIVLAPVALKDTTANGILAGIRHVMPQPLAECFAHTRLGCLQVTSDSASSNHLLVKHVARTLPEHTTLLYHRCFQHQAHLSVSYATVHLNFLGGLFSASRVLSDAHHLRLLRIASRRVLERQLERRVGPPPLENRNRLNALLQTCLLHPHADSETSKTKEVANQLRQAFSGDIRVASPIVFST